MKDKDCTDFLRWCLPKLRLRWQGFRKVRRQVCRRIGRRIIDLGLDSISSYRSYLEENDEEWGILDSMCHITISRFYRDRKVFDTLGKIVFPMIAGNALSQEKINVRFWSAGCSCGEEAYTLKLLWKARISSATSPRILATGIDNNVLDLAKKGSYPASSLKDLPEKLIKEAFVSSGEMFTIKEQFRENIDFVEQDIRKKMPNGRFNLILCRNLVFTYFEESLQHETLEKMLKKLLPAGFLVIGIHEKLPGKGSGILPFDEKLGIYIKNDLY